MIIVCKAIDIIKGKNGNTVGYVLQDMTGQIMSIDNNKIKAAIIDKKILVTNLKVTSNNRLINENIDIDKNFVKIANRIEVLSGIKHNKPYIDNFYFRTDFGNTGCYLRGLIDTSECYFGKINNNNINDASEIKVTSMTLNSILSKLKSNREKINQNNIKNIESIGTTENDTQNNQSGNVIMIKASDFQCNHSKLEQIQGIVYDERSNSIRVCDESINIVIDMDIDYSIHIINSKFNSLKVVGTKIRTDKFKLQFCEVNNVSVKNARIELKGNIIYNELTFEDAWSDNADINFINTLKVKGSKRRIFNFSNMLVNNVFAYAESLQISAQYGICFVHNFKAKADTLIDIVGTDFCVERLDVESKQVAINVNMHKLNVDESVLTGLNNINTEYTYGYMQSIIANHFVDGNNVIAKVNIKGEIIIHTLVWKCGINPKIDRVYCGYNKVLNAELIQNDISDEFELAGGIAITEGSNIEFNNIKIPIYNNERGNKTYKLVDAGLFLIDDSVKNFSITIKNSIKPTTKRSTYDTKLVIEQLVKISEIQPIKVYYGTQAYEVLASNGAKLDIINEEDVPKSMTNASLKEKIIGMNMLELIHKAVKTAISSADDKEYFDIDTGINVELPDDIINKLGIIVKEQCDIKIDSYIKSILALLELFPANNLPFTKGVFDIITKDTRCRTNVQLQYVSDNVSVSTLQIVYSGIDEIDTYVIVLNGRNLIYMTYIGDCELVYNNGTAKNIQNAVQNIRKLNSVDFLMETFEQDKTTSTIDDSKIFIKDINTLINENLLYLYDSKSSTIATVADNFSTVTFKVKCTKEKRTPFDKSYARQCIKDIESIKTSDNIENIISNVDEQYRNSVLLKIMNNKSNSDVLSDCIPECKVSSLWQLAQEFIGNSHIPLDLNTTRKILSIPLFKELSEKEFNTIVKKAHRLYNVIQTDKSFLLDEWHFNGSAKRYQGDLMGKLNYIYMLKLGDGSNEYYAADMRISDILKILNETATYCTESNKCSFEDYISAYVKVISSFEIRSKAPDIIASRLRDKIYDYEYINVQADNIWKAMDKAEEMHRDDVKQKILNAIGMTEAEYKTHVNTKGVLRDEDVAKMTKSQELLDILGIDEETFDELVEAYKMSSLAESLTSMISETYVKLFQSGYKMRDNYKIYSTSVIIIMCKKTGYCYLVTKNGPYIIPAIRLASFKDALILRKQLIAEHSEIRKSDGITQDLGWEHSDELADTIGLQLENNKDSSLYPDKYKYLVSYIPEEPVYEDMSDICNIKKETLDNKIETLDKFSQAYLMQYIQMGAIQIINSIPPNYRYNKTYELSGATYKAKEYISSNNKLFAYNLDNDTLLLSEYSFKELFSD